MQITGYFDDSGHPDNGPCVVVAGFVSTEAQWTLFEAEWSEVLKQFEIETFHMKDFSGSWGEFKPWKGNEKRREAFIKRLIKVIKRRTIVSVSSMMLMKDYKSVDAIYTLSECVTPYAVCSANTQYKTKVWLKDHGYPVENLATVYEDGSKDKGKFVALSMALNFPVPIFAPKGKFRALEAADFIAWELGKVIRDVDHDTFRIRKTIDELRRNAPRVWGIYERSDLLKLCKTQRLARRDGKPHDS